VIPEFIRNVVQFNEKHLPAPPEQPLPDIFFRGLDPVEEAQFRQWARDNFKPGLAPSGAWHPVVRQEWQKLQGEYEGEGWQGKGGRR